MIRYFLLVVLLPVQLLSKSTPDSLQTIDLQHKNLYKLPLNFEYTKVLSLHLGYNPLKIIPAELLNSRNLKNLSINYNPGFDFESSISTIKQLKLESLSINNSNLMYMPLEMGQMKTLKHLSLANNYIKEVPAYIFIHADFVTLNLAGNLISSLPTDIKSQSNLQSLNISKNPCVNSDQTYKNLQSIESLKQLEAQGASDLPKNIWTLNSLEKLDISEGTFASIELPQDAHKHQLTQLIANNCDKLDFSFLISMLSAPSLKEITLGGDKFTGFNNANISNNVSRLELTGDVLSNFTFAASLSNLNDLILNFNSVTCGPELLNTISKMNNLKSLNLSNCGLTDLPLQIKHLTNLETLNLSGNKLTSVNELFALKKLVTLDISFCELSKEKIERLKKELPNTNIIYHQVYEKLPLPNAIVKTENFTISPTEAQTITTQNGTTISIPKNSLIYGNGKLVKEPVTINYTPYYTLADVASSGINMNYKTAEGSAPFSSAGMFNINALAKDQPVELKKGSEMTIAFKSNDPDKSYNYYSYDTINRTWKDIGKDTVTKIKVAKPLDSLIVKNDSIISRSPNIIMPQPPLFYAHHDITIHWDTDKKDKLTGEFKIYSTLPGPKEKNDTSSNHNYFTEVKSLSKITWKLDEEKTSAKSKEFFKNNALFNHNVPLRNRILVINGRRAHNSKTRVEKMVDFELSPDKERDCFLFKFYDETDTITFYAYPLVQTKNVDRAQKSIKKMFFTYENNAKERKELTKYRRTRFLTAYNQYRLNMANARASINVNDINNVTSLLNSKVNTNAYNITRVLQLQGFGVYNCDKAVFVENPIVFTPIFIDERGNRLSKVAFQVIDPKENIVVSYYGSKPIRISKNSIITFMNTQYDKSYKCTVYMGKLNTINFNPRTDSQKIQLSPVSNSISIGELSEQINSNN
ncbi:MAG: leucine-rich repeat domain-containing protein [Bacteroidota bacterium]